MKRFLRQRGVAAVEMGVLLLPLVVLTFGTTNVASPQSKWASCCCRWWC